MVSPRVSYLIHPRKPASPDTRTQHKKRRRRRDRERKTETRMLWKEISKIGQNISIK